MSKKISDRVFAVILVGGKGKRLRPLSTDTRPKAFLSITANRKTMFKNTVERICKVIAPSRVVVVANKMHRQLVKKDMGFIGGDRLILEPIARNTAPAIAVAAEALQGRGGADVIVVLPTDHYIPDERQELACLRKGIKAALAGRNAFIVFGVKPTFPATGYGYIKLKNRASRAGMVCDVARFVEKPDLLKAKRYLRDGRYLWNSGIFIFRVDALTDILKKEAPEIYRRIRHGRPTAKSYAGMPDISIDRAVMERVKGIGCIKVSYRWSDVGSFESLKSALKQEGRRFVERDGKVIKIL